MGFQNRSRQTGTALRQGQERKTQTGSAVNRAFRIVVHGSNSRKGVQERIARCYSPVRSLTRYSFLVEELRLISSPINPVRKSMVPRIIAVRAI